MNRRPIAYLQTDPRWAALPYRVPGERATIGGSGCGPTAAAMLIETLTGKTFTPVDACAWSVEHGYKALNQGTYYSYFVPQFAEFGIPCGQLSWVNTYGKPDHENHRKAAVLLRQGYYLIALMGRGLWTRSGHFVVVRWEDGLVRICDPASTQYERMNGDPVLFRSQVKYYWWVDARPFQKEEDDMTQEEFQRLAGEYLEQLGRREPDPAWGAEARAWALEQGLIAGDEHGAPRWEAPVTRNQLVTVLYRLWGGSTQEE